MVLISDNKNDGQRKSSLPETQKKVHCPNIIEYDNGVVETVLDREYEIGLPPVACYAETDAVIQTLHDIFQKTPWDFDWIVDFSQIKTLPIMILGSLTNFSDCFRSRNRKIKLINVPPNLFPEEYMEKLKDIFTVRIK